FGVNPKTVDYFSNCTPVAIMTSTSTANQGIEFNFVSEHVGFIEIYIGTRVEGGQLGAVRIQMLKKGVVIEEEVVRGEVKRVVFDTTGDYEDYIIRITTVDPVPTNTYVSGIYWWKKRQMSQVNIFKPTDKILFLNDLCGSFQ